MPSGRRPAPGLRSAELHITSGKRAGDGFIFSTKIPAHALDALELHIIIQTRQPAIQRVKENLPGTDQLR